MPRLTIAGAGILGIPAGLNFALPRVAKRKLEERSLFAVHRHLRELLEVIAHDCQANRSAKGLAIACAGSDKQAPIREGVPAENSLSENRSPQGLNIG